jgi:hypothetical protein
MSDAHDVEGFHVGDHVRDLEETEVDKPMIVTGIPGFMANEHEFKNGQTVADVNPQYPEDDPVIEVRYPSRGDRLLTAPKRYAFPASRLEVVSPIHDVDNSNGGE